MKTKALKPIIFLLSFIVITSLTCNYPGKLPIGDQSLFGNDMADVSSVEPLQLQTGEPIFVTEATINVSGGLLQAPKTSEVLGEFSISVPANAYPETVKFSIAYSPIESHNLSPDMTIITPLILINNGNRTAAYFLEVTLPCQLNPDQFAMLFIYHDDSGKLEPLPLLSQDTTQLVALTTHFSKLLGVAINKSALENHQKKTGFKHGVHNWQFPSIETDPVPGGICAGQVVTALDFYLRNKGAKLYGVYDAYDNHHDKTPKQPYDDRLAIRLATVIQNQFNNIKLVDNYWHKVQNQQEHALTFYSLALALKTTGEPQLMHFFPENGKKGHAVIVFAQFEDDFSISDPNSPKSSYILNFNFSNDTFRSITRSTIGTKNKITFKKFYYMNKYDFINAGQMTYLWSEFMSGTIGDQGYPATYLYLAKAFSSPGEETWDTTIEINTYFLFVDKQDISGRSNKIRLFETSPTVDYVKVYDKKDKVFSQSKDNIVVFLDDPKGTSYLFTFWGLLDGWIDGRWITFYHSLTGNYHGGRCSESETDPYRWEVELVQQPDGSVSGTVKFHNCPGGGAVNYSVSGTQKPGEATVSLLGVKTSGRGELGNSSPGDVNFTFGLDSPIKPNYAP